MPNIIRFIKIIKINGVQGTKCGMGIPVYIEWTEGLARSIMDHCKANRWVWRKG